MAETEAEVSCTGGVVLYFNAEAVLFEFAIDEPADEVQIGMVKPSCVKVGTKFIPANVKKVDTLSKYIEVGDELNCTVVRKEGLKKVKYKEDDDEVEIQALWLATTAVKVVPEEGVTNNEVEMENPFYEPRRSNRASSSPVKDASSEKDTSNDSVDEENSEIELPAPVKVVEADLSHPTSELVGLELPEPVSVRSENPEDNSSSLEDSNKSGNDTLKEDQETVANDLPQSKTKEDDPEEEDMLELEVNQSEFEELGGSNLDSSQEEKDGEEDIEIIEITEESGIKRKLSTTGDAPTKKAKGILNLPSPVTSSKGADTFKVPAPVSASKVKNANAQQITSTKEAVADNTVESRQNQCLEDVSNETADDEETCTAKLVQFNKSSSVKLKGKVTSGILEMLDGEHRGKRGLFQVASTYVWGHHLANANLMYHLRTGDKFLVQVTLKVRTSVEEMDVPLIVKKCWIGVKSEVPLAALMSVEFSAWLMERSLQEGEFLKWISDLLPPKPFFPLKSGQFEAKVIMLIRESPKGDGALVRVTKEGDMKDNLAVFERDDFYICGVHVGEADMRFLIRPGDSLSIQVKELSEREKKQKTKKYPKLDEFEFNHSCLLAYIGDSRPRGPNMKPTGSPELRQFLDGKGMSIKEFSEMRDSPDPEDLTLLPQTAGNTTQTQSVQPPNMGPGLLPPPMMNMNWLVNPPPGGVPVPMFPPPMLPTMGSLFPTPVSSANPAVSSTESSSGPNMEMITKCSTLVAKAVLMGNAKDPRISDLLKTEEDIEHGLFLAKMFTSSLVANVQGHLKEKLKAKVGSSYGEVLSSMNRQLDMAKAQLINTVSQKDIIQAATTAAVLVPNQKPMSHAMLLAQQSTLASLPPPARQKVVQHAPPIQPPTQPFHINIMEQYDKQQQEPKNDFNSSKGLVAMSDMKKRLEAFKAAKKVDNKLLEKKVRKVTREDSPEIIEVNDNSKFRWDNKEALEEQSMSPLELLRKYTILKRPVDSRGGKVYFREISFPKDCRTNLKINKAITGTGPEFYTLGCLLSFLKHRHEDHPEYVRKCISEDIKCVRRTDRANVEQYLTGSKDFVLNLENLSHRQLNPELFGDPPQQQQGMAEYGGSFGGEYGGGNDPVVAGKNRAEKLVEQWRSNQMGNKERCGSGGDIRRSSEREKHSSDRDRRISRGRDSRSGERERRRDRSRSRERRRTRSKSREKSKRSRSRSNGQADRYDPFEPTVSPTSKPLAPPPPPFSRSGAIIDGEQAGYGRGNNRAHKLQAEASFDIHQVGMSAYGQQERSGVSPFDQRQQVSGGGVSPFDQRTKNQGFAVESPFDQRPSRPDDSRFDQRSDCFDQMDRSNGNSANRNVEDNQQGRRSKFDQEPQSEMQNQTEFGQSIAMRNQSRFGQDIWGNQPRLSQEDPIRQPATNHAQFGQENSRGTVSRFNQGMTRNQSRFDQETPRANESEFDQEGMTGNQSRNQMGQRGNSSRFDQGPRSNQSRFDQEDQASMMHQSRYGANSSSFGQGMNTGQGGFSEYGDSIPVRNMNFDQMGENDQNQDSSMFEGDLISRDGNINRLNKGGGAAGAGGGRGGAGDGRGASSSLGPMFIIGSQGGQNSPGNMAPNNESRRW